MCRFAGFLDAYYKREYKGGEVLQKMNISLIHGGPDGSGFYLNQENLILFGATHRRLSILDLDKRGNQPMTFGNLVLVFNGEIYNFKEIKKTIKNFYTFKTNTDTEVILKSFHYFGVLKALQFFRGMFAIALFHTKLKKLYLIRDRLGIKPLYYFYDKNKKLLVFGSEINAILQHPKVVKELDHKGFTFYLKYGFTPYPITIYKKIYKVPPGTLIEIDLKHFNIKISKYWEPIQNGYNNAEASVIFNEKKLTNLINDSIKHQTIADVNIGTFLSGGIDSTLVTVFSKKTCNNLKTFTLGFTNPKYNESNFAKKIAEFLQIDHKIFYLSDKEVVNFLPKIFSFIDEPLADPSLIATYFLSKKTSYFTKVVLSGDGGDELFCGYSRYFYPFILLKNRKLRDEIFSIRNAVYKENACDLYEAFLVQTPDKYIQKLLNITTEEIPQLYKFRNIACPNELDKSLTLKTFLDLDLTTYLSDNILLKVDKASMLNALEVRVPFLDEYIVKRVLSLPTSIRCFKFRPKYWLRKILSKYIPERFLSKAKKGFTPPYIEWLTEILTKNGVYILVNSFLDRKTLEKIFKDFVEKKQIQKGQILWNLYVFNIWYYSKFRR